METCQVSGRVDVLEHPRLREFFQRLLSSRRWHFWVTQPWKSFQAWRTNIINHLIQFVNSWPFDPIVGGHDSPFKGSRKLTITKRLPAEFPGKKDVFEWILEFDNQKSSAIWLLLNLLLLFRDTTRIFFPIGSIYRFFEDVFIAFWGL